MTRLAAGDPAPPLEMNADDGSVVSNESLAGSRYVLYFYPKDDTPGCTAQACGLRDSWAAVSATGVEIFGVSPDSVKKHVRFREK
ncbi:MAG: peroxiredoxin, partial [Candidatus Limnocylindria bacterium]